MIQRLVLEQDEAGWRLVGDHADRFALVNDYLGYLADRNYSPATVRTYAYGLLRFCRWLLDEDVDLAEVSTDVLLRFLAACRSERIPGRAGPNVVLMDGRRADAPAAATVNLRLAAISGCSRSGRCATPQRRIRCPRAARRRGGPRRVSAAGCSATWPVNPEAGRCCGCGRRVGCRSRWNATRSWGSWRACGPGATGRSPG